MDPRPPSLSRRGISITARFFDTSKTRGSFENPAILFKRMTRLNPSNDAPTPEEFYYCYDNSGRMTNSCFAMTPRATSASGGTWYGTTIDGGAKGATSRALAHYDDD